MRNVFIAGPAEISLFQNDQLISVSKTMLNNSISIEASSEDIRGGYGALLLGKYWHTSSMTMELEDSMFRMEWIKYATGALGSIGDDVLTSETVTLGAGGAGEIVGTPAPLGSSSDLVGWVDNKDDTGTFTEVTFSEAEGKYQFTLEGGTEGEKVCVKYYSYNGDAQVITISANIIPDEVRAVAKCQLFAGSVNAISKSSRVGFVYIEIPRLLLSGGASLSLTSTGASTTPLSGTALAYDSPDGCDEGGYYAKIIKVEEGYHWYDSTSAIYIADSEIDIKQLESQTLKVLAYGPMFSGMVVNNADLTFTSSADGTATVDKTGKVSGVAEGECTIKVVVTNKPSLVAFATVNVTTAG